MNEGSATFSSADHSVNAQFTYSVPEEIPPAGGSLPLEVAANDVNNNSGIAEKLCVQSPFKLTVGSGTDPCAYAFAKTPMSSASGSKDLTLLPSGVGPTGLCPNSGPGSPPECVMLDVEIGGGNLYFTYRASAPPKISYSFRGAFKGSKLIVVVAGRGSFQLATSPTQGCADGTNAHGSALVTVIHRPNRGTYTARLQSLHAEYCKALSYRSVAIEYRIPTAARCDTVRAEIQAFEARDGNSLDFSQSCGLPKTLTQSVEVKISST